MEGTVKFRLLLTSALFLFVQIPTVQAQVTVDVVKITCEQLFKEELPWTSTYIILWLSGYYHRETQQHDHRTRRDEETLNQYCCRHGKTTVMDAVKNMGLGK